MKQKDSKIIAKRKRKLEKRLDRTRFPEQPGPVFAAKNIHYEIACNV